MTYKARLVLEDCQLALALLEEETDPQRWRIHWAAAVALIRAVGHVLRNVDCLDPVTKQVGNAAFKSWKGTDPRHEIFRDFIEHERNNLLKEYRSDVHPLDKVAVAIQYSAMPAAGGNVVELGEVVEIGDNIYRPLLDGPWKGDDARDVLTEAIKWWERQLNTIDRQVSKRRIPGKKLPN